MTSRRLLADPVSVPARRSCSRAPERYYAGRRRSRQKVFVVSRSELEPLAHLGYRSDAGFDWGGAPSDGALELAFAMLTHTAQSEPPDLVCRAFAIRWWLGWTRRGSRSAAATSRCGCRRRSATHHAPGPRASGRSRTGSGNG